MLTFIFMQLTAGVIYRVYSDLPTWAESGNDYGGDMLLRPISTAQGLVEFECESSVSKQKWVDNVRSLLCQASVDDAVRNRRLGSVKLN
jgi:hypothetical protein